MSGSTVLTMQGRENIWSLFYTVFKIRISVLIMLCALAGVAVSSGSGLQAHQLVVLALAVLLSSASAGAFNHYVERDLDARMKRTHLRPFVTGVFRPGWQWIAGIVGLLAFAVGMAALATNAVAALYVFLGAFTYGVVYTLWLKRRTWTNIVFGGLAGSFAVLAGAAAVQPGLHPASILLAVVLFLWTPPHFWSLAFLFREQYRDAGVPMLPSIVAPRVAASVIFAHTLALSAVSLALFWFGLNWVYLLFCIAGCGYFLHASYRFMREPSVLKARKTFSASLAQLGLLLVGAMLDAALPI